MNNTQRHTAPSSSAMALPSKAVPAWRDLLALIKFRLTLTVVFSAVMAYLIAAPGAVNWVEVLILSLGGLLVSGAANALNQVLEKDFDAQMSRTANRPLAAKRMSASRGVLLAGMMAVVGVMLLALFNPWTAVFGMLAMMSYAFLYTPMKRHTPAAVTVGAFPGALPALIGAVAAQGELTLLAFLLFVLQFLWQFPHFSAIGWLGHSEYKKAGFRFVPEDEQGQPHRSIGWQAVVYSALLVPLGVLLWWMGFVGTSVFVCIGLLSTAYTWISIRFFQAPSRQTALQLMFASFFYLPLVLVVWWADKVI